MKQVLWGQSLAAAFFWGCSNFLYSVLDHPTFEVTCLSWTGFLGTAIAYRVFVHFTQSETRSFKESMLSHLSSRG